MMFLQPGDGGLGILLRAVHFGQHNAELHAAGVIHLRTDNVVVDVEPTRGLGEQRRVYRLAGKLHAQHRHAVGLCLGLQALLVIFRNIQMQRGLNKLLGQRRLRMREHFADRILFN